MSKTDPRMEFESFTVFQHPLSYDLGATTWTCCEHFLHSRAPFLFCNPISFLFISSFNVTLIILVRMHMSSGWIPALSNRAILEASVGFRVMTHKPREPAWLRRRRDRLPLEDALELGFSTAK